MACLLQGVMASLGFSLARWVWWHSLVCPVERKGSIGVVTLDLWLGKCMIASCCLAPDDVSLTACINCDVRYHRRNFGTYGARLEDFQVNATYCDLD